MSIGSNIIITAANNNRFAGLKNSKNRFLRTGRMPSLYKVHFFNIWFGMVQHQKQLGCTEGRKFD